MSARLHIKHLFNLLLLFIPITLLLEYVLHASATTVFVSSALAIIPLAGLLSKATEELADRLGEGIGGLLNATFGNATELIIGAMALSAGLYDVTKASLTGSIIGNILLVFGMAAIAGGVKYPEQRFNQSAAGVGTTMLAISAVGLVLPAIATKVIPSSNVVALQDLSLEISIVLFITYLLSLIFMLKTHKNLYMGSSHTIKEEGHAAGTETPLWRPLLLLLVATLLTAWMSHALVGAIEGTVKQMGINEVFVGVIIIAIVGNAAAHSTAIVMAMKNKMDLAINITTGSSIQVALFVAPMLLFLSYALGPAPMDLHFSDVEVLAVGVSVGLMALTSNDGDIRWIEGVQLVAVYIMLGMMFYALPIKM